MKRIILFVLSALLLATACQKDPADELGIGIEIDPATLSLRVGETAVIQATVTPDDLLNKTVLWTTDNTDVAKVRGGVVTGVAPGTATITAKTDKGGKTAKCKVTVLSPILVSAIQFGESRMAVDVSAGTYDIPFTVVPENATNKTLLWESSDSRVVTVSDGVLKVLSKGTATITATAADGSGVSSSCEVTVLNVPVAVDLGLSVKWASFNLGAEVPEGEGDYYAWGELTVKDSYDFTNYRFSSSFSGPYSKYNTDDAYGKVDNKTTLEEDDDAAAARYLGTWRIPTEDEFTELMSADNCTWTWTQVNGKNGYRVTGKKAGYTDKSIFLPAAGFKQQRELLYAGEIGFYWTASLYGPDPTSAVMGYFDQKEFVCSTHNRFVGLSIRPVCQ